VGCCSLKRDPAGASWPSVALVCAPLALFGPAAWFALKASTLVVPSLAGRRDALACLLTRNAELLNRRFKHLTWRCTLSGLLLRRWPRASGRVFRSLYPAMASAAWLAAVLLLAIGAGVLRGGL
jgi:hypothetical protein